MGEYNNYPNRETFKAHLIIDNNEALYKLVAGEARKLQSTPEDIAKLADFMQTLLIPNDIETVLADKGAGGLFKELLTDAVFSINWHDVASRFIEDEGNNQ